MKFYQFDVCSYVVCRTLVEIFGLRAQPWRTIIVKILYEKNVERGAEGVRVSINVTTTPHHCTGQQPRSEIFRPDRRDGSYTNTTEPHSLHIVVNPITSVHDNAFVNDPIRIAEISFRNTQLNVFVPNSMSDMVAEQKWSTDQWIRMIRH